MYILTEAKPVDSILIQQLAQQVFPHTYQNILTEEQVIYMLDMMYTPSLLKGKITTQSERFFIAYKTDVPCGYLSFEINKPRYYYIQKIYVLPEYQGEKCGLFLYQALINLLKDKYLIPFFVGLNVNKKNKKALNFYKKLGMQIIDSRKEPIGNGFFMDDYILEIKIE